MSKCERSGDNENDDDGDGEYLRANRMLWKLITINTHTNPVIVLSLLCIDR